jgi:CheY-like chemotaxis protein
MQGGTVEVRSEGTGKGSQFIIRLPVSSQHAERETQVPQEHAAQSRRVLIVEDNEAAATMLSAILKIIGNHEVQIANDGETGLKLAKEFHPEVVLLDIGLPGIDGYEVAKQLRAEPGGDRLLVIAITGYGLEEDRLRSREAGFDEHVLKPMPLDVMERLFQHPKLAKQMAA